MVNTPSTRNRIARIPVISRDHISLTGEIPQGYTLFQDDILFKMLDFKKGTLKNHPLLESIGIKEIPVMRCKGVFQRADEKNANGRIYPLGILKEAVKRLAKPISERRVMGEFDHPPDAKIHLDRVSHLVTNLWAEDKTVMGEIEVINDDRCPCGSMLACYLDRGIQIGISSRGVGDMELVVVEGEDAYQVQDGFEFITFDAVAEPSVTGTQLKKLNEAKERQRVAARQVALREAKEKVLAEEVRRFFRS
jgi:hypothetical protein